jgi:hypothetical protein
MAARYTLVGFRAYRVCASTRKSCLQPQAANTPLLCAKRHATKAYCAEAVLLVSVMCKIIAQPHSELWNACGWLPPKAAHRATRTTLFSLTFSYASSAEGIKCVYKRYNNLHSQLSNVPELSIPVPRTSSFVCADTIKPHIPHHHVTRRLVLGPRSLPLELYNNSSSPSLAKTSIVFVPLTSFHFELLSPLSTCFYQF